MRTVTTDLSVLLTAVTALQHAVRYDEALAVLDATEAGDDADRLILLMSRAEVTGQRDYAGGVRSAGGHPLEAAEELAAQLRIGPTTDWDLAMLRLRRQYADELLGGIGPAGRDQSVAQRMAVEATRLRDAAPDRRRRGWALMCLGWIADNLRGDRAEAPRHYAEALDLGRDTGDPVLVFEAQRHLGDHAHDDGDHAAALDAWQESTEAAARGGHVLGVLAQQVLLAVLARDAGDEAGAVALATEVRRWAAAAGATRLEGQATGFLSGVDPTAPPESETATRS